MSKYQINKEALKAQVAVGFNNSADILNNREPEWDILAEIAVYSQDPTLIKLFESLPTIEEWDKLKAAGFVAKQSDPAPVAATPAK